MNISVGLYFTFWALESISNWSRLQRVVVSIFVAFFFQSLFGKRKYHRGTIVGRRMAWILGGICREDGKMFLVECPEGKRDRVTLGKC